MSAYYVEIRWLHILAVAASGSLFLVRGLLVQTGRAPLAMAAPLRWLSVAIDSVLLAAALMLVTILPAAMFANGWLAAKLALLVLYIVLGSLALRRGRTARTRRIAYVLAALTLAFMVSIARAHDPLGFLRHWLA